MRFRSTPWWMLVAAGAAAWGIHATAIGISFATIVPPLIALVALGDVRRRAWPMPIAPLLLGLLLGLTIIFVVETCLGFMSARLGPLYPPERAPAGPEPYILRFLGWLYAVQASDTPSIATWTVMGLATLADVAMTVARRSAAAISRTRRAFEETARIVECVGAAAGLLLVLTFANALDVKAAGLNLFAAHYRAAVTALGDNAAAAAALGRQVENLKALDRGLREIPPTGAAKDLVETAAELIRLFGELERAAEEEDAIDETPPASTRPALDDSALHRLPDRGQLDAPPAPADPGPVMRLVDQVGRLTTLQQEVATAVARRDGLSQEQRELLQAAIGGLRVAAHRGTDLPDLPGQLEARLSERIAILVAKEGLAAAVAELRRVREQLRARVAERQRANAERQRDKAEYRRRLERYRGQQRACVDAASTAARFLKGDPAGQVLADRLKRLGSGKSEFGARFDPPPYTLETRPRWTTGREDANRRLDRRFEDEISAVLYGRPGIPPQVAEGHASLLRGELAALGLDVESPGFALLKRWIESLCAGNATREATESALRGLANRLPG